MERTLIGTGLVLQIATEPLDEGDGRVGILVLINAPHHLLGVPCSADLPARIEQPEQLRAAVVGKAFVGSGEHPP